MLRGTLGSLMIDEALPEPMRGQKRVLNDKGLADLFQEVAEKYPGDYRQVSHRLSDVGREVSQSFGGYSFGLKDLQVSPIHRVARQRMEAEIEHIMDSDMDEEEKQIG